MLVESVKSGLPSKSVLTTEFSFSANILPLILFSFFKRVYLFKRVVSTTTHRVCRILKIVFKIMFFKWLKPILRLFSNFSPNGLFILQTLLEFVLMKFNKCFSKISKEAELWISEPSLFLSRIADEKRGFLKKLCLTFKGVMLFEFLVVCIILLVGIKLSKYGGELILN